MGDGRWTLRWNGGSISLLLSPDDFRAVARDDRELGSLPVIEQQAPLFRDGGGVAQVLLVHHLHECGVVGAEDELAHACNLNRASRLGEGYLLRHYGSLGVAA